MASSESMDQYRKLFVGGLNPATTDDSLREFYEKWGEVEDCVVMCDPVTKRSRGFGFITYTSVESVSKALNDTPHIVDKRQVDPKRATPREEMTNTVHRDAIKKVFVGGIGQDTQDQHLREYFSSYGRVHTASVMTDKMTGNSRGFGFVVFEDSEAVDWLCNVRMHTVNGHKCEVKKALPRDDQTLTSSSRNTRGSRYGGYGDRPPNASSGMVKPPYGGGRNDGYSAPSYGSYGSTYDAYGGMQLGWKQDYNAGGYVDSSNLGTGYQYAYGGGAMKGASYAAKAAGPYGGGYGSASGYNVAASMAPSTGGYSTSYPVGAVSGYTSYGASASAYGSNPAAYGSGYPPP